jgi:hypothetical protein
VITKNNWLSYAMAAGFIASLLVYVSLLVQATSAAGQTQEAATEDSESAVSAGE